MSASRGPRRKAPSPFLNQVAPAAPSPALPCSAPVRAATYGEWSTYRRFALLHTWMFHPKSTFGAAKCSGSTLLSNLLPSFRQLT